jgi:hypothetical protein
VNGSVGLPAACATFVGPARTPPGRPDVVVVVALGVSEVVVPATLVVSSGLVVVSTGLVVSTVELVGTVDVVGAVLVDSVELEVGDVELVELVVVLVVEGVVVVVVERVVVELVVVVVEVVVVLVDGVVVVVVVLVEGVVVVVVDVVVLGVVVLVDVVVDVLGVVVVCVEVELVEVDVEDEPPPRAELPPAAARPVVHTIAAAIAISIRRLIGVPPSLSRTHPPLGCPQTLWHIRDARSMFGHRRLGKPDMRWLR